MYIYERGCSSDLGWIINFPGLSDVLAALFPARKAAQQVAETRRISDNIDGDIPSETPPISSPNYFINDFVPRERGKE